MFLTSHLFSFFPIKNISSSECSTSTYHFWNAWPVSAKQCKLTQDPYFFVFFKFQLFGSIRSQVTDHSIESKIRLVDKGKGWDIYGKFLTPSMEDIIFEMYCAEGVRFTSTATQIICYVPIKQNSKVYIDSFKKQVILLHPNCSVAQNDIFRELQSDDLFRQVYKHPWLYFPSFKNNLISVKNLSYSNILSHFQQ